MNGIEATRVIHAACPTVRLIGLSMCEQAMQARPMLATGATGYGSKAESPEVPLATIRHCEGTK